MSLRTLSPALLAATLAAISIPLSSARATPSFARQSGFSCTQCHTQFPELTPFGRAFKASAFTMTNAKAIHEQAKSERTVLDLLTSPPLGVMVQVAYTHLNQPLTPAVNDDVQFPQQLSVFYAGKIAPMLGAFMQVTYSGASNSLSMDNTDIRFAQTASVEDTNLIYGLSLNNNPSVQDLWNSTPAWGFPWAGSAVAPTPSRQPLIAGALAQQVAGLGAYAFWNNLVYAEVSLYHSGPLGVTRPLGTPLPTGGTDATNVISGVSPYWRLALEKDFDQHSFTLGTFGMETRLLPGGAAGLGGPRDHYIDTAVDFQYQYIGDQHIFSLLATWMHENSFLDATSLEGGVSQLHQKVDTFRITGGYIYDHLIGARLSYFTNSGTVDTTLNAPAAVTGSATGDPFSNGLTAELDYTPWVNTKFVLQYTSYFNFNGGSSNYDGAGRDASANNTLYLLAWLAY